MVGVLSRNGSLYVLCFGTGGMCIGDDGIINVILVTLRESVTRAFPQLIERLIER